MNKQKEHERDHIGTLPKSIRKKLTEVFQDRVVHTYIKKYKKINNSEGKEVEVLSRGLCICAGKDTRGKVFYGWSSCIEGDQFSYFNGRMHAYIRLIQRPQTNLTIPEKIDYSQEEVSSMLAKVNDWIEKL